MSHLSSGLLSALTYLVSRVHRALIYGASPGSGGRWAQAVVQNSFQAVKIILPSAEMDLQQPEPGTTRDRLRFQWGFSFLCSSLRLAENRVCWKEEMTFQGPSHLGGDAEAI